mgnify:FL=1
MNYILEILPSLLRMLAGLETIDSGQVIYNG